MLSVNNLNLILNNQIILNNISFNVNKGEILSIIGPSGCGKTSILKSIAGLHNNYIGDIILEDCNLKDVPINKRQITLVFQDYSLFPHMNVLENMDVATNNKQLIIDVLTKLHIFHLKDRFPHQMSGGEQQRVSIARSIVYKPKILLLDEPFSNIDAITTKQIRKTVYELLHQYDITTIMVTHDISDTIYMSDKCVVMEHTNITQFDTLQTIYNYPKNEFVASLFGSIIDIDGKKYRPENIKIHFKNKENKLLKVKILKIEGKLHYNTIICECDNIIYPIDIIDYQKYNVSIGDILYLQLNNPLI